MPYNVSEINPAKTAFIIVDMENDFVAEGAPLRAKMAPEVVPPLQRPLAHARLFRREPAIFLLSRRENGAGHALSG